MVMTLHSPAFAHHKAIPRKYTADGAEVTPPLAWSGVPTAAAELALIVDDPDALTTDAWVHWVIYRISAFAVGLPENVSKTAQPVEPPDVLQGTNSWSKRGYGGPAPPPGHRVHHYRFRLYALNAALEVDAGLRKGQLLEAMDGHIIAEAELIGTYRH